MEGNGNIVDGGSFTADGSAKTIQLRFDPDWMYVKNYTTTASGGAGTGVDFTWYKGMADDYAFETQKLAADESGSPVVATSGGFTYISTQTSAKEAALNATGTAISAAAIPIVAAASTAGLVAGDTVRFVDPVGAAQFGGVEFQIDTINANTNFRLVYAPQIVVSTTCSFYPIRVPPSPYPVRRFISKITAASPAVITTTVDHGYVVGQTLRMNVSDDFGMTQMDGLVATVTAVTASTITTDIDSSTFTAFAWPLTAPVAANGVTHAHTTPFGGSRLGSYEGLSGNAFTDTGYIGLRLAAGTDSPAGAANDVIYWQAGNYFNLNNE